MNPRAYALICAAVFLVVTLAHLSRLIAGWDVTVAGRTAPHWISIPGLLISGLLSAWGFVVASRAASTR